MTNESVSEWIANLKTGEAKAAQELWNRYASKLTELARARLAKASRTVSDEDDLALSVFNCICRGASTGKFSALSNRDELWWLLLRVTRQKAIDKRRFDMRKKRAGGAVRTESEFSDQVGSEPFKLDTLISCNPSPLELAVLAEEHQRLLSLLRDDLLQQIAILRIEGNTVNEIVDRLGITKRAVERKLQLIRLTWQQELLHEP